MSSSRRTLQRWPSGGCFCLAIVLTAACSSRSATDGATGDAGPPRVNGASAFVDVFIGTADADLEGVTTPVGGAGGSTYPAAALPFGMVQLGPDTTGALPGGYHSAHDRVFGFSATHLNGAGCPIFRDVPFLPFTSEPDPSSPAFPRLVRDHETAHPGYYAVQLDDGVDVELTATQRSGFVQLRFPGADGYVSLFSEESPDRGLTRGFEMHVEGDDLVTGSRTGGPFCVVTDSVYTVHFAIRFERPFAEARAWSGGEWTDGPTVSGSGSGLSLRFEGANRGAVRLKVGLSYVDVAGALANLDAENPDWDFDRVHADAIERWNERLDSVHLSGGDDADRTLFYTALYRSFLQPAVFSDADGRFTGFDGEVRQVESGERYANFSGWDVYRSWVQLAAVLAPGETSDFMTSLVDAADRCGALPKWSLANDEAAVMVGDPAGPALASARAFGARGFDAGAALRHLVHTATTAQAACNGARIRPGLADLLERGYVPADGDDAVWGAVSTTLEYAVADFAIARLAAALGEKDVERAFMRRGLNWKNVFDAGHTALGFTGYVQPRLGADSGGRPVFQRSDVTSQHGFVEGNAAQYTWMVPHDVPGLLAALGGQEAALARIEAFFEKVNAGTEEPHFYMGNEPLFGAPWLPLFAGQPSLAQSLVRRIVREAFSPTPGGLPGNDDLGATSSWLVWAMLGLYPAIPGEGILLIGAPLFPEATIRVAGGNAILLRARGAPSPHVRSLAVNGSPWNKPWIEWERLARGATLEFVLTDEPEGDWGTRPEDAPPSFYPPASPD